MYQYTQLTLSCTPCLRKNKYHYSTVHWERFYTLKINYTAWVLIGLRQYNFNLIILRRKNQSFHPPAPPSYILLFLLPTGKSFNQANGIFILSCKAVLLQSMVYCLPFQQPSGDLIFELYTKLSTDGAVFIKTSNRRRSIYQNSEQTEQYLSKL